jgi:hypothetical protein
MHIITSSECPPLGVMDKLMPGTDSVERMQFWLLLHTSYKCERMFRTMVLRECLPAPAVLDGEDAFQSI